MRHPRACYANQRCSELLGNRLEPISSENSDCQNLVLITNFDLTCNVNSPLPDPTGLWRKLRAFTSHLVASPFPRRPVPGSAPGTPGLWSVGPRLFPHRLEMIPAYCTAATAAAASWCRRTPSPYSATPSARMYVYSRLGGGGARSLAAKSFSAGSPARLPK